MRLGVCWEPLELTAVALQQSGGCCYQGSAGQLQGSSELP